MDCFFMNQRRKTFGAFWASASNSRPCVASLLVVVRPFGPWSQRGPHTGPAGVPDRQVAPFLSHLDSSNKPPDPGATSQGPAGGDGWYVFEWRRISPAFPLRVKGEPCVGRGRLARWVALPPAITLSWVTTRRWLTHQRRARGSFSQTDTLIALLATGEQYGL